MVAWCKCRRRRRLHRMRRRRGLQQAEGVHRGSDLFCFRVEPPLQFTMVWTRGDEEVARQWRRSSRRGKSGDDSHLQITSDQFGWLIGFGILWDLVSRTEQFKRGWSRDFRFVEAVDLRFLATAGVWMYIVTWLSIHS